LKIEKSIILQLRRQERQTGVAGMTKSGVINWYLESLEDSGAIETEEALLHQRKIVKSVLTRMIKTQNILLEMKDTTRLDEMEEEEQGNIDPVLVISPSYNDE
jgi:DNA replication licensing factor MCM6